MRRLRFGLAVAVATACGGPAPREPSPSPTSALLAPSLTGLSPAYRQAFSERLPALAEALGPCAEGEVALSVDYADRVGAIVVRSGLAEACAPRLDGDLVDLRPLVPVGRALAAYRDRLAAEHDPRLATFRVGVAFGTCEVWLAGQFPPDGSTFAPCVRTSERRCLPTGEGVRAIRDPELARAIAAEGGALAAPGSRSDQR